jgi:predicted DCC family thiol-disulfide oxidoreductase YuxK
LALAIVGQQTLNVPESRGPIRAGDRFLGVGARLDDKLRITVGTPEQNEAIIGTLTGMALKEMTWSPQAITAPEFFVTLRSGSPNRCAMTASTHASSPHQEAAEASQLQSPGGALLDGPIVFFDGECVMCNTFLDWMMLLDQPMTLKVAPLQGTTAQQYLPPLAVDPEDWSIYLLDEAGLYSQSDAVIRIAQRLGGVWALAATAGVFPRQVRDGAYRAIAQNRYRLFGKRECRLPSSAEQARFLP